MPIEKATGFKVGDKLLATLAEAQKAALIELLPECDDKFFDKLIADAPAIVAILSPPKELRQRKRRADFGSKRKKPAATPKPA